MVNVEYRIILPTNVKYLDITRNYIELLKMNWPEAYKHLIISVTGPANASINFDSIPIIRNREYDSLPSCVYNAALNYKADYYLVFLGDAFISKPVNNKSIESLLQSLIKENINYCRLLPQFSLHERNHQKKYRRINTDERYGHSFIAFGASPEFIKKEFSHNITDRDFEIKYLKLANRKENLYFKDRTILQKNLFHILPSIQKGKWDRVNYFYLKKKYPKVSFSNRGIISWKYECILQIRKLILPIMPDYIRKKLKYKNFKYFDTKL
ncbi:hypothetical protein [Limosilactobacillus panis]|uniref:Glycosyltransferase n=1 Tax=Limosilactobacillus panis DSM 6035 TaxID=1423782 RepID=A0A0R1XI19_9LACO|nr:hypothetical protein [Limosilactobacillus panis]KRM29061.1 hypothetical protein FD32_GL001543 [Limosilactobacillus panis DSM 6035]